ncbi:hypothetical protein UY3_07292 [Chelonia mydas]|uniref:Uncharacterized protein n=1 Tax=Chelonia mydas TaxID=8469 RepID=M7BC49_CHEMY|nr:hypothetical protein UY3_07292 [Chelonia mydas]
MSLRELPSLEPSDHVHVKLDGGKRMDNSTCCNQKGLVAQIVCDEDRQWRVQWKQSISTVCSSERTINQQTLQMTGAEQEDEDSRTSNQTQPGTATNEQPDDRV